MSFVRCCRCRRRKIPTMFWVSSRRSTGRDVMCKACRKKQADDPCFRRKRAAQRRRYLRVRPERMLYESARYRARKRGVAFRISLDDIRIPILCPVLGIKLRRGEGRVTPRSPTIDRIDPERGYIPGNIWVISHRANTIKSDATLDELVRVVRALRGAITA